MKELKPGDPAKPVSHGICLPCMGFVIGVPIEDLTHIPPEYFDDLPYGVIQLKGEGTVVGYNKTEASLSKLDPARVRRQEFLSRYRSLHGSEGVRGRAGQDAVIGCQREIGASISVQISARLGSGASGDGLRRGPRHHGPAGQTVGNGVRHTRHWWRRPALKENATIIRALLRELRRREGAMLRLLERFVVCESPSHDKIAVDAMGQIVAEEWRQRGAKVRIVPQASAGITCAPRFRKGAVVGRANPGAGASRHRLSPWHAREDAFSRFRRTHRGPGTFDMKGGLVMALCAVDALQAAGIRPGKRVVFLWTSDEEIGSGTSRKLIESEARRSKAVLVLEPSLGSEGHLKTSRKGVGSAELLVRGRAAHAGINPEDGVNAVHELALQIERLIGMNDPRRGITVQATVVSGGTVSNVVPDQARAQVDIRFTRHRMRPGSTRNSTACAPS